MTAAMVAPMLAFEWRYHVRRLTFLVAVLGMGGSAAMLVGTGYGPAAVHVNSPYTVMQSMGLLVLVLLFVLTIFCANGALRDTEHGMTELVFSRPVGEALYLGVRFAGVMVAAMTVMLVVAAVLMVAPFVLPLDSGRVGGLHMLSYVWPLVTLVLPDALLAASVLFAIATLTRSTLATYVGGIAIFALYFVTALLVDSPLMAGAVPPTPEALARAAILDPFGLSAFFEQTRYWTPAERDARLVALSGRFLTNRVLWLSVATAILLFVRTRFRLRSEHMPSKKGKRFSSGANHAAAHVGRNALNVPYITVPTVASGTFWPALRSALLTEARHVLRSRTFIALLALWAFVAGMQGFSSLESGEYATRVLATSGLLVNELSLPLLLLGSIAVVYYAAEVAWRERTVGIDSLVDGTPASSAVFFVAKVCALSAIPLALTVVAVVVALVVQWSSGGLAVRPFVLLSLVPIAAFPLMLFAIGALSLQVVSSNRWLGMLAGLGLALLARRGDAIGIEHPMLRFADGPSLSWSDFDGFGPALPSFAAFMLYWSLFALLLGCVSWGLWPRGQQRSLRKRLAALPRTWGGHGRRVVFAAAVSFVALTAALFRSTNVVHAWESSSRGADWQAAYERAYRRIAAVPQPRIVAVRGNVDLVPERRSAVVHLVLVLENRDSSPIDTLWVNVPRDAGAVRIVTSGAHTARADTRLGVHVLAFDQPLRAGGKRELTYDIALDRSGIRAGGFNPDVAENGTYLTNGDMVPAFGYRAGYEIQDPAERRKRGLGELSLALLPLASADSLAPKVRLVGQEPSWITLDLTISTSADQRVIAPGRLIRSAAERGRSVFQYATDGEITPRFAIASARYDVRRIVQDGIGVEMYFHPAHSQNVDSLLAAGARSLRLFTRSFGPYPYATLRMVEVPSWLNFGAFAVPGMLLFTEDRGVLSDPRTGDVDLITRRVAHEVAHQWWGHTVDPLNVAGATTIVETLAKYSEQRVLASVRGESALPPMLAFDHDRYLAGRAGAREEEPTLMETAAQEYLYYGKGAIAMHALHDALGDSAMVHALRSLVRAEGGPHGAATSRTLYGLLMSEAVDVRSRALVDEWFTSRVTDDLAADSAVVAPANGSYRLKAWFRASRTDMRNREARAVPDDELYQVDVAVYGEGSEAPVLYQGRQYVRNGRIELSLDVPARPAFVEIDPEVRRIDRDRSNNRKRVELR